MVGVTPEARWWAKVDQLGPVPEHRPDLGPCWPWTAALRGRCGYGAFQWRRRVRLAHRFGYELLVGPIPEGLQLDHLCRVRHCVNPAHLEPVTPRENIMRGEGLAADNAQKDRCVNGHAFDEANTYWRRAGGIRACRACRAASQQRYRDRKVA